MSDNNEMNKKKKERTSIVTAGKPKKKKKKVIIVIVVILILAAAAVLFFQRKKPEQPGMTGAMVELQTVQKRDLSDAIALKGTIAGASRVNVTSKAASEITSVDVQVGDVVQEGDPLCTLDATSIQEKISQAQKTIANSNSVNSINSRQTLDAVNEAVEDQQRQLAAAQKQIDQAQEDYDEIARKFNNDLAEGGKNKEMLFESLKSSERALETAMENLETVRLSTDKAIEAAQTAAELDHYKDSDSTQKDTLSNLKEQLADCEIKAPCGGVVTAVNISVGDTNAPDHAMITIEDTNSLKVMVSVDESDILKLQEGMKATVTTDATGEQEIAGTVARVVRAKNQSAGEGTGTNTGSGYSAEISIDSKELLVGMTAKAKIMIQEKKDRLAIPYDSVRYDEDGKAYVLTASENADGSATAEKKSLEVGEEINYYIEVTGGDLKEGDRIIYDVMQTVVEGQTLTADQMYSSDGLDSQDMQGGAGAGAASMNVEVVQ